VGGHRIAVLTIFQTASESRQLFRSLVKRSIESWKILGKKKVFKQDIKQHSQTLRGLDSLDDFLNQEDRQYWFFQLRKAFMRQRTFQKWDPAHLNDYILLPVEGSFANEEYCMFVSHYWHRHGNPDPEGVDLRKLQEQLDQGYWGQTAYFWVDFTCLPQWERTESQEKYFRRALLSIPKLVRDCSFTWHFSDFQPRLWVLFETAEFVRNRSRPIPLDDIRPFITHLREMKGYGVRYVLNRHGYRCTNQGDRELVIGWLELLLILSRLVPSIRIRRAILNAVDDSKVRSCHHEESGITVNKEAGIITVHENSYEFSPIPFKLTANSNANIRIEADSYYKDEVQKSLDRVERAPDNRASEEIGREYDREGEYKIGEVLHRMALAAKDSTFIADVQVGLDFLAENLENQELYEEAEKLRRRAVSLAEKNDGTISQISREKLATVVQKQKRDSYYRRWKLESLDSILELEGLKISKASENHAVTSGHLERQAKAFDNQKHLSKLKGVLWILLETRKETPGPYHSDTLATMCNLARVLRYENNLAAAAKLFWLAFAISDDKYGPEHVKTLAIMSEFALCVEPHERKEVYRQQLERHLRVVDFDHPDTYTVKHKLNEALDQNETIQIEGSNVRIKHNSWYY
jgi:tetratricopeptide (TPR) repeat protein